MSNRVIQSRTYKSSGVSIDSGNELVESIKPLVASTSRTGSIGNIGSFGGLFDIMATGYKDPILVSGTDGVGTKLLLAIESNRHESIGIDLVAMCANDVLAQGAEPMFFLDYFACGSLDVAVAKKIISSIAKGCQNAGCSLIGGETAEMPGMYKKEHYDLAGFCVGAVDKSSLLPQNIVAGDIVLGVPSSGAHANGYSLIRKIISDNEIDINSPAPFEGNVSLIDELIKPTRIYVKSALAAMKSGADIHAFSHITGGGLIENIPRVLPKGLNVLIDPNSWSLPPLFKWIHQYGRVDKDELYKTFNCGIGLIIIAPAKSENALNDAFRGETIKIGEVVTSKDSNGQLCNFLGWETTWKD